jgi:isoaspartyl peptidase/L-asparaginase-like protein (Ntn-hydrolase superfamily)
MEHTVFKLARGSWTCTLLRQFSDGRDGGYPVGSVALDAAGNLYGTASAGGYLSTCGGKGCGVVFKITP